MHSKPDSGISHSAVDFPCNNKQGTPSNFLQFPLCRNGYLFFLILKTALDENCYAYTKQCSLFYLPFQPSSPPLFLSIIFLLFSVQQVGKNSNDFDYGSLKAQLIRSLDEVRNKTRFSIKSERLTCIRDSEISTDASLLPCYQQQHVERTPYNDSTEKPPLYRQRTEA